ncbi:MAG TPA: amino acid adenylation domain-containing protein [Planosporangium sp.]|nr:amino acid adenylation domain-containing protein [Planosporangium sp.]
MNTLEFLSRLRGLGIGVHLENERLRVRAPKGTLDGALRDELAARRDELKAFLLDTAAGDSSYAAIPPAPRDVPLPLSYGQQRLWFLQRLNPDSTEYNVPVILRVAGPVGLAALERALATVIARHEALRTTFQLVEGVATQVVHPPGHPPLTVADVADLAPREALAEAERLVGAETNRPFDLASGPLLRALAVRLGPDDHVLALVMHHIVCDEWSAQLLHAELSTLYDAFRAGRSDPLPPLTVQYADYTVWQRRQLTDRRLHDDLAYWRQALADLAPLELPADRPRPPVRDPRGGVVQFTVALPVVAALDEIAHKRGATLFMALLAAFQVLLARYAGQDDIAVGTPIAGRTHPDTEPLIGFFVNTLVLRTDLAGNPTFPELLDRVRETTLNAYGHQALPFEQLVERLAAQRDRSRHPLFQVMLNVEDLRGEERSPLADTCLRPLTLPTITTARFDLRLILTREAEAMSGVFEYRLDLFDGPTVEQFAERLGVLLAAIAEDPTRPIGSLPILTAREHALLPRWTSPPGPPAGPLLPALASAHAATTPDALAVSDAHRSLTWSGLDAAACRVGRHLRRLGVGPEAVVAIAMDNSVDLVTAILGVWYAGGAFVALNPVEPLPRVASQLTAVTPAVVLADEDRVDELPAGTFAVTTLSSAEDAPTPPLDATPHPDHLAYLVFTSGSTGTPKPVAVTHANLAHYAHAVTGRLGTAAGTWLLAQRLTVDLGLTGPAVAFVTGARLHVADPDRFGAELIEQRPDHVKLTPAHLAVLLAQPDGARGLPAQTLVLGGEAIPDRLLTDLAATGWSGRLHNHYGPAETTVGATTAAYPGGTPPLGTPLPGTACHVLDRWGRPAPVGVAGELCIGGPGLARGYLGAADLTAQRFVANPFSPDGSRLYRSGDRARWRPDGALEFLGRLDDQLNVNGYRVDPAEIERELCAHPAVTAAAVRARTRRAGGARLIAWLAPAVPDNLRGWLAERLPPHLVPDAFVALDRLPLNAAGKLDHTALPEPEPTHAATGAEPPVGQTERALADLWRELLDVGVVNRDDNFFDLGGHSLLATQLLARIPGDLPLTVLFDYPTLRDLAERVDEMARDTGIATEPSGEAAP